MGKKVDKTAQKGESMEQRFSSLDFINPDYVTSRFDALEEKYSVDRIVSAIGLVFFISLLILAFSIGYDHFKREKDKTTIENLNAKLQNYDNFHNYLSTSKKIPVLKYIEEFESKTSSKPTDK